MRPFIEGFGLSLGLIVAIGAQNAFVLRQGLARRHVFLTALVSTLCDSLLIGLGVGGLGALVARSAPLTMVARWGGALFLLWFGVRAFRSAWRGGALEAAEAAQGAGTRRATILAALGFSLLNPHVYLDTVVLLGSLGAQYAAALRWRFGVGAILASATWFFGLAYGAAWLAPHFRRPALWRLLDVVIGLIMVAIALALLRDSP